MILQIVAVTPLMSGLGCHQSINLIMAHDNSESIHQSYSLFKKLNLTLVVLSKS